LKRYRLEIFETCVYLTVITLLGIGWIRLAQQGVATSGAWNLVPLLPVMFALPLKGYLRKRRGLGAPVPGDDDYIALTRNELKRHYVAMVEHAMRWVVAWSCLLLMGLFKILSIHQHHVLTIPQIINFVVIACLPWAYYFVKMMRLDVKGDLARIEEFAQADDAVPDSIADEEPYAHGSNP
jgi:hypothetical protein